MPKQVVGGTKFVAKTECRRIPVTLCANRSCQFVSGPEECHNKTIATVTDVPEESCDLVPQKTCKGVYRLVPYLHPIQECKDIPRQVCSFGFKPAVAGEKPITTKWCYAPNEGDILQNMKQAGGERRARKMSEKENKKSR